MCLKLYGYTPNFYKKIKQLRKTVFENELGETK